MRTIYIYRTAFVLVGPIPIYRFIPEKINFGLFLNKANSVVKNSKS